MILHSPVDTGQAVMVPDNSNLRDSRIKSLRDKIHRYGVDPFVGETPPPVREEAPRKATIKESNVTTIKSPTVEKFKAEIREITPELALDWLTDPKYKAPNRGIRKTKVASYVQSMREGRWHITGEAIKFDNTGRLLDGQHRLNAVVDSGVTIQSLVITGVDPKAQDVMDTGAARDAKDVLGIHDVKHASIVAAGVRILVAYEAGRFFPGQETPKASNDEILEYALNHSWIADMFAACQADVRNIPVRGGVYLGSMSLMAMADREEAMEFTNRLASGHQLEVGSPILVLRNRLQKIQMERERHSPYTMVSLLTRAFQSWRNVDRVEKYLLYKNDRPIPIPELKKK